MKINQPFETKEHDLTGYASIDLYQKENFNGLAQLLIANYNSIRFEPMALRVFIQKKKPIITFYVLDKFLQERKSSPKDKLPTRKFKIILSFEELISSIKSLDLTVTNRKFDIKNMTIINK